MLARRGAGDDRGAPGRDDPAISSAAALFAKGDDAILERSAREATETVMAGARTAERSRIVSEVADLSRFIVLGAARPPVVWVRRASLAASSHAAGVSGHAEKAGRGR